MVIDFILAKLVVNLILEPVGPASHTHRLPWVSLSPSKIIVGLDIRSLFASAFRLVTVKPHFYFWSTLRIFFSNVKLTKHDMCSA